MNMRMNGPTVFLDRWQTMELIDAAGAVAAVKTGSLWITMEDDQRDIVLGSGESWTIDRNGRTLVHAEKPTTVRLTDALATRRTWKDYVQSVLNAIGKRWSRPMKHGPIPYY